MADSVRAGESSRPSGVQPSQRSGRSEPAAAPHGRAVKTEAPSDPAPAANSPLPPPEFGALPVATGTSQPAHAVSSRPGSGNPVEASADRPSGKPGAATGTDLPADDSGTSFTTADGTGSPNPVTPASAQCAVPSCEIDVATADEANGKPVAATKARAHRDPIDHMVASPAAAAASPASVDQGDSGQGSKILLPTLDRTSPVLGSGGRLVDAAAGDPSAKPPSQAASSASLQQPTVQLGQALAAVHTRPDGTSQIRILLNPAELGSVQVRITRTHDGASSVSVAVERPETLRSLQTDLGHLHQALDRAGMPEQRSLELHLVSPETPSTALASNGFGGSGMAQGESHQAADQGRSDTGRGSRAIASPPSDAGLAHVEARWTASPWRRVGVNITA